MLRNVLHTRLYTSADGREHLMFTVIYIIIVALFITSVLPRAVQKGVRRAAALTGIILIGWIAVRLIKYELVFTDTFVRYLWYGYYLFQLSLPILVFWLAWVIDKPEDETAAPPVWLRIAFAINMALIALVMTNDLHNLVFKLDLSNPNWSNEYGYGFGFYLVQAGCFIPLIFGIAMMLLRGRSGLRKSGVILPPALFVLLTAYTIGYVARIPIARDSDIVLVVGLLVISFMGACIRAGMIPVNSKYMALFTHSRLGMQITDKSGGAVLSSVSAVQADRDLFIKALASNPLPAQNGEDTLLFAAPVTGGYAMWHEDIAGLNHLQREIEESVTRLEATNALLLEEEKIKRAVHEENAKTLLMAKLETEISGNITRLAAMVEQLENADDQPKEAARIALLLCCIKRRSNLFFREMETPDFPADELVVYLDELVEMAGYAGVKIIMTSELKTRIAIRHAALFYDFFYQLICRAISVNDPNMLAYLGEEGGDVVFWLLPSADAHLFGMEESLREAISVNGGKYMLKDLDGADAISLSFPGPGGTENG
jgi:hypothetical protein